MALKLTMGSTISNSTIKGWCFSIPLLKKISFAVPQVLTIIAHNLLHKQKHIARMESPRIKMERTMSTNLSTMGSPAAPLISSCVLPFLMKPRNWLSLIINHGAVSLVKQLAHSAIVKNAKKARIAFSSLTRSNCSHTIAKRVTRKTPKAKRYFLVLSHWQIIMWPISLPHVDTRSSCTRKIISPTLSWNARKSMGMKYAWERICASRGTKDRCVTSVRSNITDRSTAHVNFALL